MKGFPALAPMQVDVAGGFTAVTPRLYVLISLAWLAGFALLGLLIFWWKTRTWSIHSEPLSGFIDRDLGREDCAQHPVT